MAQLVKRLTLAQVTILRFMGLSSALGSVLTPQSLEPASDSVSTLPLLAHACVLSLSLSLSLCLSQKQIPTWFFLVLSYNKI